MKKSTDRFIAYLDILHGTVSYGETSRLLGQAESTIYRWIAQSKKDAEQPERPSEFSFAYGEGNEIKYLHQHIKDAINMSIEEIESAARGRARHGVWTVSKFQGRTVWRVDPELEAMDPEVRAILGYKDCLLRDENGQPVPELNWTPPSTDLTLALLSAYSRRFRRTSQVNVDVRNQVSGGVMLLNGNAPQAKTITHQAALPLVEILESAEPEPVAHAGDADADIEDVETDEPAADGEEVEAAEEPVAVAPVPPPSTGPNPAVRRDGLSALQKDLLARAQMKSDDPNRWAAPVGTGPGIKGT